MSIYYVYSYIRESDGTPYYIGKGKGSRAYSKNHTISVPNDRSKIIFLETNLTEQDAFDLEIKLIFEHGRKDLGTGILHNKTNGGEGISGAILVFTDVHKANMRKPKPPRTKDHSMAISMAKINNPRDISKAYSKTYKLTPPIGESFIVTNLSKFCKTYGLSSANMYSVALAKRKHHKGWICIYLN